jgi:hypothetical protein
VDTQTFAQITEQLSNASTRRTAVKRLGALALGAAAVAGIGRAASARDNPKNDNVDKECLNRCRGHNNNRCHQRCRRKK